MGTSVNQRSPDTSGWKVLAEAYQSADVAPERVLQLLWRAALREPCADVGQMLSSDGVLTCLKAAMESETPGEAFSQASTLLANRKQQSLAVNMAKRAAALSCTGSDVVTDFAISLFVQATDYFVSRDLPSYVGEHCRNRKVSEAIKFKDGLRDLTAQVVRQHPPAGSSSEPGRWRDYVKYIVSELARSRR